MFHILASTPFLFITAPAGLSGLDDNTGRLAKQIDHPYSQWRTSSSMIDAVVNGTSTKSM